MAAWLESPFGRRPRLERDSASRFETIPQEFDRVIREPHVAEQGVMLQGKAWLVSAIA